MYKLLRGMTKRYQALKEQHDFKQTNKPETPLKDSYVKTLHRPVFQGLNTTGLSK